MRKTMHSLDKKELNSQGTPSVFIYNISFMGTFTSVMTWGINLLIVGLMEKIIEII